MKIAFDGHIERNTAMPGDLFEHMIEIAHTGRDPAGTVAIEIDGHGDIRLGRLAAFRARTRTAGSSHAWLSPGPFPAQTHGRRVSLQSFQRRQPVDGGRHRRRALGRGAQNGRGLLEGFHRHPAIGSRGSARRQGVIGTGGIVSGRLRRESADKDRTGMPHQADQALSRIGLQDQVLRGVGIGDLGRLFQRVADHRARLGQRHTRDLCPGQLRQLGFGRRDYPVTGHSIETDQHDLRRRIVLGLAEQVAGDEFRVGTLIGDDHHLARSRRQVDRGPARQSGNIGFGRSDIGIAGPENLVSPRQAPRTGRQGRNRLGPADRIDLVNPENAGRRQERRVHPALACRRHHDDNPRHARQLGRHGQHDQCRDKRRTAGGHIERRHVDRRRPA